MVNEDEHRRDILLLTDYRGAFASNMATRYGNVSMDVERLIAHFSARQFDVTVQSFAQLDLERDFTDLPVVYTSSEDSDLRYRSYIEDLIDTLHFKGARLLPRWELLRAHHNKTMMEGLRRIYLPEEARSLGTRLCGTFEELATIEPTLHFPVVVKSAFGAGSTGVASAKNAEELRKTVRRLSKSPLSFDEIAREKLKRILRRLWQPRSLHREKYIVQRMIEGLAGDFKVLRFGRRFYVLYRHNRASDFRASGGGRLSYQLPAGVDRDRLLDYAESVANAIDSPTLSLDVAFDGGRFWTIEFQCLHFGTYTAEFSEAWYGRVDGHWTAHLERCEIEQVYAEAIVEHLMKTPER